MDKLGYLESFLAVLDHGSLSAAARVRKLSQPAISQQMSALESFYGVCLLHRSTSGVRPTREGSVVARHAQDLVSRHRRLLEELENIFATQPQPIRVVLSPFMRHSPIGDRLQALASRQNEITLDIIENDQVDEAIVDGYDLALRVGSMGEATGIARKIGRLPTMLVAAPSYLRSQPSVTDPTDLGLLTYIRHPNMRGRSVVKLRRKGAEFEIEPMKDVATATPAELLTSVLGGRGFCRLMRAVAKPFLQAQKLELLLPGYDVEDRNVFLVYPHQYALTSAVRVVIREILDGLTEFEGAELIVHPDLQNAA